MAARGESAVRPSTVGAVALLVLQAACYPNPDDLRVTQSGGGSGGASGGSPVGGAGGLGGSGPGTGGHVGTGGMVGAGGAGSMACGGPACGGNVLGTWTYVNTCSALGYGDCGEVINASGVHRSGTVTFNANGTYSTIVTDTGTFILDEPAACLDGATCAEFQAAPAVQAFSSAACSTTATGCHCLLGALGTPQAETGTYVANGVSLTTTSSTGSVNADTYCVNGSTLRLIYPTSTAAMPDESVFTKQ